jgi:hypothetical protein
MCCVVIGPSPPNSGLVWPQALRETIHPPNRAPASQRLFSYRAGLVFLITR